MLNQSLFKEHRQLLLLPFVLCLVSLLQYSYTVQSPILWDSKTILEDKKIHDLANIPSFFLEDSVPERAEMKNLTQVSEAGWVSNDNFPVAVAGNFLERSVEGHLFNLYRWGGYLLWRIGPEQKVFVDGRSFDGGVIRDALAAEMVGFKNSGMPLWKKVFDKYHIDSAILPISEGGARYALTMALYRDPDWTLAYQSGNAALFLKRE
jgi:hypothetical protein